MASRLAPRSRLGPYEILSTLGVGGMGEVYRARDTKLGRDVAIKVLLPAVANDPERLERFKREATILASLNHPNIGAIHGLEDGHGVTALVLELVEGPTLADRIATGQLPLKEALSIARQIADALEAAHASGIVHRDLKPANIKITRAGAVKVLDFGLAKAAARPVGTRRHPVRDADPSPGVYRRDVLTRTRGSAQQRPRLERTVCSMHAPAPLSPTPAAESMTRPRTSPPIPTAAANEAVPSPKVLSSSATAV